MALVMAAEHQQVATQLIELLQHHFRRLDAGADQQLAAGRGVLGQAAVQCLLGLLMFLAAFARVEYMQDGQFGIELLGQLGGAAQRHIRSVAQVVGNKDVTGHGRRSPADACRHIYCDLES